MMKKFLFVTTILFLSCAFAPQKKTKVIFFGDSITEIGVKPGGYITRVQNLCKADGKADQYDFIGSGISGDKVYDLYLRLDEDVLEKHPDMVVIWVGVNDVWHKTLLGTGTDLNKFERFYLAILKKLKAENIQTIICTPAVVGEKNDMSNPLDGDLNRYANVIRDIAKSQNIPLIDFRKEFYDYEKEHNSQNKEKGILTYDKVHPNDAGNQFISKIMWETILKVNQH